MANRPCSSEGAAAARKTGAGGMLGDRFLNVSRGVVLASRDNNGVVQLADFEAQEVPLGNGTNNVIFINALTVTLTTSLGWPTSWS